MHERVNSNWHGDELGSLDCFPGVTVQAITPGYVCTDMAKPHGDHIQEGLFIPNPNKFAAHALRTLGFSSFTTGYWVHGFQAALIEMICEWNLLKSKSRINFNYFTDTPGSPTYMWAVEKYFASVREGYIKKKQ